MARAAVTIDHEWFLVSWKLFSAGFAGNKFANALIPYFRVKRIIMKRILIFCSVALLLMSTINFADACVGRILIIGTLNSSNEKLLAEMVSVLMNERTGTNVKIVQFKDSTELYNAVKKGEVGLVIESVERGIAVVGKSGNSRLKTTSDTVKKEYRKNLSLVWLEPFGESQHYAPVVAVEVLGNLPALPKLVSKLANIINDETFAKLLKAGRQDGKYRKVASDFLKAKKLI